MRTQDSAQDAFEQRVRKALDQYEVPYNSADWAHLERSLNTGAVPASRGRWGLAAIMAAGLLAGGAAWYISTSSPDQAEAPATGSESTMAAAADAPAPAAESARSQASREVGAFGAAEQPVSGQTGSDHEAEAPAEGARTTPGSMEGRAPKAVPGRKAATGQASTTKPGKADLPGQTVTSAMEKEQRTFRASVSQACAGTPIEFMVERMPDNGIYLWNFGDGSFSNKANPEHTFTKPGRYQVMLSMSSAGGGFIQNKPSSDVIVIHEAPKAAFNVVRQEYDGHLPSIHFENRSLGGMKYHWDFGDGQGSDIAHPDHIYKAQGTYRVELTVTNPIGCEDVLMKEVRIEKDYNLDAPATFSPNGDGHDDTFMPEALMKLGVKFTLSIYDLNGNLMYETRDAKLPWSGKPRNRGEVCPPGEYAWVVDVRESLHLAETYTGKVRLVR